MKIYTQRISICCLCPKYGAKTNVVGKVMGSYCWIENKIITPVKDFGNNKVGKERVEFYDFPEWCPLEDE